MTNVFIPLILDAMIKDHIFGIEYHERHFDRDRVTSETLRLLKSFKTKSEYVLNPTEKNAYM